MTPVRICQNCAHFRGYKNGAWCVKLRNFRNRDETCPNWEADA